MIKKISSAILAAALSCASFTGNAGGGDAGDFGDGVVLSPQFQPQLPFITLRNCWTEWRPVLTHTNGYWLVQWVKVEVCQ